MEATHLNCRSGSSSARPHANRRNARICSVALLLTAALASAAAAQVPPPYDHVVIAIMENHSYSQIIGNFAKAPYINALAAKGANFTQSFAITHPSQPNYLDLYAGSNHGVTNDTCLVGSPLASSNLGGQLIAAGFTFVGYSEDLPAAGSTVCTSGLYARKHNPWVNFSDVPAASNQPFTAMPSDFSTLPTLSFVVPNQCNDMHNGSGCTLTSSVANGDVWLQANLDAYVQWAPGHNSLFILTFDEDDGHHLNQITTIFVGSLVIPGNYSDRIDHYSVLATLEAMYELDAIGGAAATVPITAVWDTRVFSDGFD